MSGNEPAPAGESEPDPAYEVGRRHGHHKRDAVRGLFEIQLVTDQLAAMESFYRELVGLPHLFRDDPRGRVHLGVGDGQLILAEAGGEAVLADWPGVPPQLYGDSDEPVVGPAVHGPMHFAFQVDLVQWGRIVADLAAGGVATRGPLAWGTRMESLYFLDPDGNCGELIRTLP